MLFQKNAYGSVSREKVKSLGFQKDESGGIRFLFIGTAFCMYLVTETSPLFHLNRPDLATCPTIKLKKWKSWFVGIEVTVINIVRINNNLM